MMRFLDAAGRGDAAGERTKADGDSEAAAARIRHPMNVATAGKTQTVSAA